MDKKKHSPEPWIVKQGTTSHYSCVYDANNAAVTGWGRVEQSVANARRITACVNYCADKSTEELEAALPLAAQPEGNGLICIGELIEIDDDIGTKFVEWNDDRYELATGAKIYAALPERKKI